MDNSDICITHGGVTKRLPIPNDVQSLYSQVGKVFDGLPSKWNLTYTVEVQDAMDYLFFIKKGFKFLNVEQASKTVDTDLQSLLELAPTGPKKHGRKGIVTGALSPQSPFKSPTFRILSPTELGVDSPKGKLKDNVVRNLVADLLNACKDSLTDLLSPPKACKQLETEVEARDLLMSPVYRPPPGTRRPSGRKGSEPSVQVAAAAAPPATLPAPEERPPPPPGPVGGRNIVLQSLASPLSTRESGVGPRKLERRPQETTKSHEVQRPFDVRKSNSRDKDSLLSPRTENELEAAVEITYRTTCIMEEKEEEIHKQRETSENLHFVAKVGYELKVEEESFPKRSNEVVLPAPPTSAYEVCNMLGVESAALAVLAPPPLITPRYRYRHTPEAILPPEMAKALSEMVLPGVPRVHLAINDKISPRPRLEAPQGDMSLASALVLRESKSNTTLRFMDPRFPVDYQKLLRHQLNELDSLSASHNEYSNMMKGYEVRNEEFFKNNQKVASSVIELPLDEETKIKRKLAGLIGVNTWDE